MRRAALLMGLTAALIVPQAASAHTAIKSIWGDLDAKSFGYYHALGVKDVQLALDWSAVVTRRPIAPRNPNDPAYVWPAAIGKAVKLAKRDHIGLSMMLIRTPAWANDARGMQWAPDNPGDYADFAAAAAKHYRSVHRWMIWGEPGRVGQFQPETPNDPGAPRLYARLLDAAYGALKQVSRRNIVIGGMTFTGGDVNAREWIRWMRLPSGKPPRLDWWGHNPFSTRFPDLKKKPYKAYLMDFSDLDTLESLLRGVYHRSVSLWLSEFTIQSDRGSNAFSFYVSKREQARWLTRAYAIANAEPWIAGLGWVYLRDQSGVGEDTANWGLLSYRWKKKPAYFAYKRAR